TGVQTCALPILLVVASCSNFADEFFDSMYGNVCAPHSLPINKESHCEKLRAFSAREPICTKPRYEFCDLPAEIPFEMMVDLVFFPKWIIFVPVSACWKLLVTAIE